MQKKTESKTVDFAKAIQNLTDILVDDEKFAEFVKNIYDAIDSEGKGSIAIPEVESFVRDFLRGDQSSHGELNTNFESENENVFKMLNENESGEVTMEELSKFLDSLLKNQVRLLAQRVEQQKYERSLAP